MCREPVTLGGGMTIENVSSPSRRSDGAKASAAVQRSYHFSSKDFGS